MKNDFRLKSFLASNAAAHPDDVLVVRKTLQGAGVQAGNEEPYPTSDLFDAIKIFQKENGLQVDGKIKPGGETERSLKGYLKFANLTRCRTCGVLHGGVYSPFFCADCFGKLRQ